MNKILMIATMILLVVLLASCKKADMPTTTTMSRTEQTTSAITTGATTESATATSEITSQVSVTTVAETTTEATTTAPPAEIKPIRSIFMHTHNLYAESAGSYGYTFYYFTPEIAATAKTKKTPINGEDPLNTANLEQQISQVPAEGMFESLCEEMWGLRFDLLPEAVVRPENGGTVVDGTDFYLIVTFEDGSVLTSSGYAATKYNRTYSRLFDLFYAYSQGNFKANG